MATQNTSVKQSILLCFAELPLPISGWLSASLNLNSKFNMNLSCPSIWNNLDEELDSFLRSFNTYI